jgi:ketosteroid isomerase-like protein
MSQLKFSRQEVHAAHEAYVEARDKAEAGEQPWSSLADFFVEDATFVDPAWGRIEGREAIREFMGQSMAGLEGWTFPKQFCLIEDDLIVSGWMNRLPGRRADGSYYEAPGISTIHYAGDGLFRDEEDLLNMVHVFELIRESGWKPGPGIQPLPETIRR